MTEREEKEAPRVIAILLGLIMLPLSVFGVLGGYALVVDPPPGRPALGWIAGTLLALLGVWVGVWGVRLILNRRQTTGGLLSPFGLRLGGAMLIGLPIGGLFTGVYREEGFGIVYVLQALIYLTMGFGAFTLAKRRAAHNRQSVENDQNGA